MIIGVFHLKRAKYKTMTNVAISRSPKGCSLTHSARNPPAVHQEITIWVDEIEFEKN